MGTPPWHVPPTATVLASAVARPKRFDRRADQGCKHLLVQTNGTSKITKLARHERHDAIAGV